MKRMKNPICVICEEMIIDTGMMLADGHVCKHVCERCANTIYLTIKQNGGTMDNGLPPTLVPNFCFENRYKKK